MLGTSYPTADSAAVISICRNTDLDRPSAAAAVHLNDDCNFYSTTTTTTTTKHHHFVSFDTEPSPTYQRRIPSRFHIFTSFTDCTICSAADQNRARRIL